jgi:hypothetical protein
MLKISHCIASLTFLMMTLALPNAASAYTLKRTATGEQVRWFKNKVALRIDPRLESMLPAGQARAAAIMASEAWRGLPGAPDITIEAGAPAAYSAQQRGNGIYLLNEWPYGKDQLAVTLVTYRQTGEVLGVDVLVNAQKRFALLSEGEDNAFAAEHDLGAVLTHELGHVLGLDESHDDEHATMWPYIRAGEAHQRSLSTDDEDAVVEAYHADVDAGQMACSVTTPAGRGSAFELGFGLLLAGGLVLRKRARRAA